MLQLCRFHNCSISATDSNEILIIVHAKRWADSQIGSNSIQKAFYCSNTIML